MPRELAKEPHTKQRQSGSSDSSWVSLALATLLQRDLQNEHLLPRNTRQRNASQHASGASGELHRYKYTEKVLLNAKKFDVLTLRVTALKNSNRRADFVYDVKPQQLIFFMQLMLENGPHCYMKLRHTKKKEKINKFPIPLLLSLES